MRQMPFLKFLLWMGSTLFPLVFQPDTLHGQTQPLDKKNVLIIYSDDHTFQALGAMGNKIISTPNLDKLAKSGLMFTQAHVMGSHQGAVCVPSRAMLMTGRYVNRLPSDGSIIPDSLISMPEVLRGLGYHTFHTGKWHSDKASHHRMFSDGGDVYFGGMHFEKDGGQFNPTVQAFDPTGIFPESTKRKSEIYSSTLYTNNALEFLQSAKAKSGPFMCYIALTSPHDPRTPPPPFDKMYDPTKIPLPKNFYPVHPFDNGDLNVRDEQLLPTPRTPEAIKREIALYYGMISEMDAQVGRILDALDKEGLRENTLIIFAGDNGLAVGQHGLLGKQNLYEHSIRVPMIFSGPGIPENKKANGFVYLSDIAPTVYEYLKIAAPKTVEAKSLMPVVKNQKVKIRENIYNIYGHWSRSIKTSDGMKLIVYNVDGTKMTQLFDLKKDPMETMNLSDNPSYQSTILSMRNKLRKEMLTTNDNLDIDLENWGRKPNQKARGK
jgi:arylsulfatase A-like enzyme